MRKLALVKIGLGQGAFRGKIVLLSEPCDLGTIEERLERQSLLRTIGEQPELTAVAGKDFETMKVYYNGTHWVVELEANL